MRWPLCDVTAGPSLFRSHRLLLLTSGYVGNHLAVNLEHFEEFSIIPLKPKSKDKRTPRFVAKYGERYAEVEAIPATDLRQMVRDAIESHIPAGEWEQLPQVEQLERDQWETYIERIGAS